MGNRTVKVLPMPGWLAALKECPQWFDAVPCLLRQIELGALNAFGIGVRACQFEQ